MKVEYEKGYNRIDKDEDDEILFNQAIEKSSKSKEVVLFVGLAENYESEGVDRNNIDFPKNQTRLINWHYQIPYQYWFLLYFKV